MGRGLSASGVEQDCAVVGLAVLLFMGASGKRQGHGMVLFVLDHPFCHSVAELGRNRQLR